MSGERQVKIIRDGQGQAISIPREFARPGDEAVMRREAGRLIVEPAPRQSLDDEFPSLQDLPIDEVEL